MLTNYDLLLFLAADKGYYTRKQHLEVLTKKYPDEKITLSRVSTLRASIINSNLIKEKVKIVNYIKAIRVVSVDEQFRNYSFKRPDEPKQNSTESYLLSEPRSVVKMITARMEFDNLLRGCHASRGRERSEKRSEAVQG